ncbi:PadR family transcriptional regulator [Fodinicurvata sp. EGI_FJ10296]|uniref:PadR family transcriptional regulator n=1 Tax=Fodinicurvata sp. EGI_FJ10296 TaxID=3231908 RepID=UPI0034540093
MHNGAAQRSAVDYTDRRYWNGIIKMSLSKFFILRVLHDRPMHGYEIARAVETTTNGCCSPTEGTIYPVLREFETGGYVTSAEETVSGRGRKVYTLTEKGRAAFKVGVEAWMEVTDCLVESGRTADTTSRTESGDAPESPAERCC